MSKLPCGEVARRYACWCFYLFAGSRTRGCVPGLALEEPKETPACAGPTLIPLNSEQLFFLVKLLFLVKLFFLVRGRIVPMATGAGLRHRHSSLPGCAGVDGCEVVPSVRGVPPGVFGAACGCGPPPAC
jgi:hypothetical protein